MKKKAAVAALSALAHDTRLDAFRLLVRHEPEGLAAGAIASKLSVTSPTLSSHLAILSRAGMITAERQGRSIVYRASIPRFRDLSLFLFKDCCNGNAELCAPVVAELTNICREETCRA